MRKTIILAAGLALMATSALAQSPGRDRDDDRRGWREERRESRDRDDWRGRSMRDDDDEPGRSRAARFFLRSGDTRVAVRCDDRDSTRACVDATLTLFDRIKSQTPSSGPASSATGGSGSGAPSTSPPAR